VPAVARRQAPGLLLSIASHGCQPCARASAGCTCIQLHLACRGGCRQPSGNYIKHSKLSSPATSTYATDKLSSCLSAPPTDQRERGSAKGPRLGGRQAVCAGGGRQRPGRRRGGSQRDGGGEWHGSSKQQRRRRARQGGSGGGRPRAGGAHGSSEDLLQVSEDFFPPSCGPAA
jgi:hypothetical protein